MAREEIQIGETTYFVEKFPAMLQMKIFGDLSKTLIPSFGKALSGLTAEDGADKSAVESQFIDGIRELAQQLDGDGLMKLVDMLVRGEYVAFQKDSYNNGNDTKLTKNTLDHAFEDMGEIVELLIFILKLNYSGFFTKYLTRLGVGQKLTAK
ncbi:phage tail assembly chaperone [Pasteurellaceae bacterium 22721_9_1]